MSNVYFRRLLFTSAGALLLTFGGAIVAVSPSLASQSSAQQPDNTANNKQEAAPGSTTADQQKESPADRDLTKKIRRSLTEDKSLSMYAHNIKIITHDGEVTLKGPVKTEDERAAIEAKATSIAGSGKVQNQLTVKQ
jgi:hyperosmotically inducible periplasmic protein